MTVDEMEERMTNAEWVRWSIYFARIGQRRELDAKMTAAKAGR